MAATSNHAYSSAMYSSLPMTGTWTEPVLSEYPPVQSDRLIGGPRIERRRLVKLDAALDDYVFNHRDERSLRTFERYQIYGAGMLSAAIIQYLITRFPDAAARAIQDAQDAALDPGHMFNVALKRGFVDLVQVPTGAQVTPALIKRVTQAFCGAMCVKIGPDRMFDEVAFFVSQLFGDFLESYMMRTGRHCPDSSQTAIVLRGPPVAQREVFDERRANYEIRPVIQREAHHRTIQTNKSMISSDITLVNNSSPPQAKSAQAKLPDSPPVEREDTPELDDGELHVTSVPADVTENRAEVQVQNVAETIRSQNPDESPSPLLRPSAQWTSTQGAQSGGGRNEAPSEQRNEAPRGGPPRQLEHARAANPALSANGRRQGSTVWRHQTSGVNQSKENGRSNTRFSISTAPAPLPSFHKSWNQVAPARSGPGMHRRFEGDREVTDVIPPASQPPRTVKQARVDTNASSSNTNGAVQAARPIFQPHPILSGDHSNGTCTAAVDAVPLSRPPDHCASAQGRPGGDARHETARGVRNHVSHPVLSTTNQARGSTNTGPINGMKQAIGPVSGQNGSHEMGRSTQTAIAIDITPPAARLVLPQPGASSGGGHDVASTEVRNDVSRPPPPSTPQNNTGDMNANRQANGHDHNGQDRRNDVGRAGPPSSLELRRNGPMTPGGVLRATSDVFGGGYVQRRGNASAGSSTNGVSHSVGQNEGMNDASAARNPDQAQRDTTMSSANMIATSHPGRTDGPINDLPRSSGPHTLPPRPTYPQQTERRVTFPQQVDGRGHGRKGSDRRTSDQGYAARNGGGATQSNVGAPANTGPTQDAAAANGNNAPVTQPKESALADKGLKRKQSDGTGAPTPKRKKKGNPGVDLLEGSKLQLDNAVRMRGATADIRYDKACRDKNNKWTVEVRLTGSLDIKCVGSGISRVDAEMDAARLALLQMPPLPPPL